MDKYVVLKLVSSEELICTQIEETEFDIKVLFPMIVKYMPKLTEGRILESVTMAPYTYFAADDQFTFQKNQIIFCKDLSERQVANYKLAIDDFVANTVLDEPQNVNDLKQALDRIAEVFGDQIENMKLEEEVESDSIFIDNNNKIMH